MIILTLNIGSSSIKYQLFKAVNQDITSLYSGQITAIGSQLVSWTASHDLPNINQQQEMTDHQQCLAMLATHMPAPIQPNVIAHRVVHGGPQLLMPVEINESVLDNIRSTMPLAPLHNPIQLAGIEYAMNYFKTAKQVAVFDTAFHHTIPDYISCIPIPNELAKKHNIKKYGFHGTSYQYVSEMVAKHLEKETLNAIICHLGNGASICAIKNSQSFDTSMGFTPAAGLIMGTRTGDIDPGLLRFLAENEGLPIDEIDNLLNKKSGLQGLCGHSDMRQCLQLASDGDANAERATKAFVHRVRLYIGGYIAILGKIDALVFTGGIGENSAPIRAMICENLDHMGLTLNHAKNQEMSQHEIRKISNQSSDTPIMVVKTQEELQMAKLAMMVVQ